MSFNTTPLIIDLDGIVNTHDDAEVITNIESLPSIPNYPIVIIVTDKTFPKDIDNDIELASKCGSTIFLDIHGKSKCRINFKQFKYLSEAIKSTYST